MVWHPEFTGENQKLNFFWDWLSQLVISSKHTENFKKDLPSFSTTILITDITKYAGLVTLLSVLDDARFMYRLSSMRVLILFI
jgi:hypothetical protein